MLWAERDTYILVVAARQHIKGGVLQSFSKDRGLA
jgi:hypothetical protein